MNKIAKELFKIADSVEAAIVDPKQRFKDLGFKNAVDQYFGLSKRKIYRATTQDLQDRLGDDGEYYNDDLEIIDMDIVNYKQSFVLDYEDYVEDLIEDIEQWFKSRFKTSYNISNKEGQYVARKINDVIDNKMIKKIVNHVEDDSESWEFKFDVEESFAGEAYAVNTSGQYPYFKVDIDLSPRDFNGANTSATVHYEVDIADEEYFQEYLNEESEKAKQDAWDGPYE